jgi:HD-GYP domain-containing protein (c-di-GMP phosphodiesterase class II)
MGARIIAVCDAFDAMTTTRPYREAMSDDDAVAELRRCAGKQFDSRVVAAFGRVLSRGSVARASEPVAA